VTAAPYAPNVELLGALPDYGPRGPLASDTQTLLSTVNSIRSQQGRPPLIGDPVVSQASRNHAQYVLANPGVAHSEQAGKPGFTGATPFARCQAAGATCGSEIASSGPAPPDAVSFSGETPDPGAPCKLKPPYGLAATAYAYIDPASGALWFPGTLSLFDVTAKQAVRGCARGDDFLPTNPLVAGHTYRGSTVYSPLEGGVARPFDWTFTVTSKKRRSTESSRCVAVTVVQWTTVKRLRRGLKLNFSSCRAGRAKVQVIAGKAAVKGRKTVTARAGRIVTVKGKARNRARPGHHAGWHRERARARPLDACALAHAGPRPTARSTAQAENAPQPLTAGAGAFGGGVSRKLTLCELSRNTPAPPRAGQALDVAVDTRS